MTMKIFIPTLLALSLTASTLCTETIVLQKPFEPASEAAKTLSSLFSSLTTVLHNVQNQNIESLPLNAILSDVLTLISQASNNNDPEQKLFLQNLKKDCRHALSNAMQELDINDYKRPSSNAALEEKEAKTQVALCNVAAITSGVANIVQNPHDKMTVGQSVGSIIAGIINLATLIASSHHQHAGQRQILKLCCDTL